MLHEQISDSFILETEDVKKKIFKIYGNRLGVILLGAWLIQRVLGIETLQKYLTRRTFYRYRKWLIDAGCFWDDKNLDSKQDSHSIA